MNITKSQNKENLDQISHSKSTQDMQAFCSYISLHPNIPFPEDFCIIAILGSFKSSSIDEDYSYDRQHNNNNNMDAKYEFSQLYMGSLPLNSAPVSINDQSREKRLVSHSAVCSVRQTTDIELLINTSSKKIENGLNHKKTLMTKASSALKKGLYEEAILDCNNLLAIDKQNAVAYYIRGCAFEKLNDIDKAIEDFTNALNIDPFHVNAAFARGACLNKKGDFAKAIDDYNMALEKDIEKTQTKRSNLTRGSSVKMEKNENSSEVFMPLRSDISPIKNDLQISSFDKNFCFSSGKLNREKEKDHTNLNTSLNAQYDDDFLEETNSIIQGDTSPIIILNYPLRNSLNSLNGLPSTVKSSKKSILAGDETVNSVITEPSFQEVCSNSKILPIKSDNIEENPNSSKPSPGSSSSSHIINSKADSYCIKGFEARKNGQFELAIEFYTKALEIVPNYFKALFYRGLVYDKLNKLDLAIQDYTQAIKKDPKNPYVYYNKGISLDKNQDHDEAIKNFTIAISLDSTKADFYHNRGYAYRKKKSFNEAILDSTIAIEIDQNHFKAYYNRALCYDKLGDVVEAEKDYLKALKIEPKNMNILYKLGNLMDRIGGEKLHLALEYYKQVEFLNNSYAPVYNAYGLVLGKLGNHNEAYEKFTKAMKIQPNNAVFIQNRGCCLKNLGRLKEALEDFLNALQYDNQSPIIYANLGLIYRNLGHYEKAIESYEKELCYTKQINENIHNNKAYCYARLAKYQQAIEEYNKALGLDPKNMNALNNRAICYEKLGLIQNAIMDFTSIISMNKSNSSAYFNRGCCYDSLGELDLAIADYSYALEIEKKNEQEITVSKQLLKEII